VVDIATGAVVARTAAPEFGQSVPTFRMAPDGLSFVVRVSGKVRLYDLPPPSADVAVAPKATSPAVPAGPLVVLPEPTAPPPPPARQVWVKPGFSGDLGFGRDGRTLFVAEKGQIAALDAVTGERVGVPLDPASLFPAVSDLFPLADGLVAAAFGTDVRVWDTKTGKLLHPPRKLATATVAVFARAVSPDGRYAFAGGVGAKKPGAAEEHSPSPFRLIDLADGKDVLTGEWTHGRAHFTADSRRLLVAETSGRVRWVELPTGAVREEFRVPSIGTAGNDGYLSDDGAVVLNPSAAETPAARGAFVLDARTGKGVRKLSADQLSKWSRVRADGRRVAEVKVNHARPTVACTVVVRDTDTGAVGGGATFTYPWGSAPRVEISPDLQFFALRDSEAGTVGVYQIATFTPTPKAKGADDIAVAPPKKDAPPAPPTPKSPGGTPVGVALPHPAPPGVGVRWAVRVGPSSDDIVFSPDGGLVSFAGGGAPRHTHDARSGEWVHTWGSSYAGAYLAGVLDDGRVATADVQSPSLVLWDAGRKSGDRATTLFAREKQAIYSVAPNGKVAFVGHWGPGRFGGPGNTQIHEPAAFRFVDLATNKDVAAGEWVTGAVRFTADSTRALMVEDSGRVRWFDTRTGAAGPEFTVPAYSDRRGRGILSADGSVFLNAEVGEKPNTEVAYAARDATTGKLIRGGFLAKSSVSPPGLSADGRKMAWVRGGATTADAASIEVVDLSTGEAVTRIPLGVPAHSARAGFDRTLRVIAAHSAETGLLTVYDLDSMSAGVLVTAPSDASVPIAVGKPPAAKPGEPPHLPVRWAVGLRTQPSDARVALDAEGRSVVAIGWGAVESLAAKDGARLRVPRLGTATGPLSPLDGGRIGVHFYAADAITVWETDTGKELPKVKVPLGGGQGIRHGLSRDGRYVWSAQVGFTGPNARPGKFRLDDVRDGKTVLDLDTSAAAAFFTRDLSRVLVERDGGRFKWFKLPSGEADGGEWEVKGGRTGHLSRVLGVSADGGVVLYSRPTTDFAESKGELMTLDGRTGAVLHSFGEGYSPTEGGVSPDGKWVAVVPAANPTGGRAVRTPELRDARTGRAGGQLGAALDPHDYNSVSPAFTPDGRGLVAFQKYRAVAFELPAGTTGVGAAPKVGTPEPAAPPKALAAVEVKKRREIDTKTEVNGFMSFDGSGKAVVLASRTKADFLAYRATDGAKLKTPPPSVIYGLSPLSRGRIVAHTGRASLLVWDVLTGAATNVPLPATGPGVSGVWRGGLSPDAKYVWGRANGKADQPGTLWVNDAATGTNRLKVADGTHAFFTADASRVLVGSDVKSEFRWYKLPTGEADGEWSLPLQSNITDPCWPLDLSDDGAVLLYSGPAGTEKSGLWTIDAKTGKVLHSFGQNYYERHGAVSPDGRFVVVVPRQATNGHVELRDPRTGALLGAAKDEFAGEVAFAVPSLSPDGKTLAAYKKGKLVLYDLTPSADAK
jgi:WD40 repeat protein